MERNLKDALQHRRSYYELTPESPIDDAKIEEIIHFAIRHIPSAFNSQSTRLVLLLHEQHKAFWEIVKRTLQAIVPAEAFVATEQKIDRSFASGYGTVLYYEDTTVVRKLQEQFPTYADNFPIWSDTPRPCTSWRYGRCSKTPGSARRSSITTRSSTKRCANDGICPQRGG